METNKEVMYTQENVNYVSEYINFVRDFISSYFVFSESQKFVMNNLKNGIEYLKTQCSGMILVKNNF